MSCLLSSSHSLRVVQDRCREPTVRRRWRTLAGIGQGVRFLSQSVTSSIVVARLPSSLGIDRLSLPTMKVHHGQPSNATLTYSSRTALTNRRLKADWLPAQSCPVNCYGPSPAQLFLISSLVPTHDHILDLYRLSRVLKRFLLRREKGSDYYWSPPLVGNDCAGSHAYSQHPHQSDCRLNCCWPLPPQKSLDSYLVEILGQDFFFPLHIHV
jgi:hypothetical protein